MRHYGCPRPGSSLLNDSSQLPIPLEFRPLNTILRSSDFMRLAVGGHHIKTLLNAENQPPETDETYKVTPAPKPHRESREKLSRHKCFEISNI